MTTNQTSLVERERIPIELQTREQWVCWQRKERGEKVTKVPIVPGVAEFASATDPETWRSFDEALEYFERGDAAGIGFVFTEEDPFVGIDLDDCRDPETGSPSEEARGIIDELDSFTEVSPSGTGYHIIVRGSIPGDRSRRGSVEMYEKARFFTVTGDHVESAPSRVVERAGALEVVYNEYIAGSAVQNENETEIQQESEPDFTTETKRNQGGSLKDAELLEKARNASNGTKFERLWNGNMAGYESQSEADMALCCLLAFWTGGDHTRVDNLFRRSELLREKWDDVHYADGSTYGEKTIERAIANTSEFYDPDARNDSSEASPSQNESSTAGSRDEPGQTHAYLVEKNRLLADRVDDLEATLEEKDERIAELEATNEALRERLSAREEQLERHDQASNLEVDERSADQDDSIWTRARRFVGDNN